MAHSENSPSLRAYFERLLSESLHQKMGMAAMPRVETYLVDLMTGFLREDRMFPIKSADGERVTRVTDMLEYGDIRLKATSFDQERQVHRHIGNLMLFCSGMFPEFLPVVGAVPSPSHSGGSWLDPCERGSESFRLASLFDYDPFSAESKILRSLSDHFDEYRRGLTLVRCAFDGFDGPGWQQFLAG